MWNFKNGDDLKNEDNLNIEDDLKNEDDLKKGPLNLGLWLTIIWKYEKGVKPEMELNTKCAALYAYQA